MLLHMIAAGVIPTAEAPAETGLVTIEEAKAWLRIIDDYEDDLIRLLIAAASDACAEYADGWDGQGDTPPRLKLAVLAHVGAAFDSRETVDIPAPAQSLARPFRKLDT